MNTRRKRYSGGPGQQDPDRNRQEARPANDRRNANGQRETIITQAQNTRSTVATQGENVAEVALQPTTPQGRQRQRTIWTEEMNQFIVRCYYRLTKLETIKTPFSKELHRQITEKYPELRNKTVQNIIDQRRVIFANKRLAPDTLLRIKHEISTELGIHTIVDEPETFGGMQEALPASREEEELEKTHMQYHELDPLTKPKLPKLIYRQKTNQTIQKINDIIRTKITQETTIEELHSLIYSGAMTTLQLNGQKIEIPPAKTKTKQKQQAWETRITNQISQLRRKLGILSQSQRPNPTRKVSTKAAEIIRKEKSAENPGILEIEDNLKQKLAAKAKRLKRLRESHARRTQNRQFVTNEHIFYRNLKETNVTNTIEPKVPATKDVKTFWENIWSKPLKHKRTKWLFDEKKTTTQIQTMIEWEVTEKEVGKAIAKTLNWKAAGPDSIQNFWYKKFKSTHQQLGKCFTYLLEHPEATPEFFTVGTTYLLPKTEQLTENPAKYRPITCLPTIYKILTSILTSKIYTHLEKNNLLDEEQKGCRKGSRGCKEQLIIDATIMSNAKKSKGSLYTAYIDYQKAFDSIPHSWLLEVMELYGVEKHVCLFLAHAMTQWKTRLTIRTPDKVINAGEVDIRRGIFQGDSLSPLWFCLALRPLTRMLNAEQKGYKLSQTSTPISHLWYMDDLKLYAHTKKHLERLLTRVGAFSSDIHMKFGLDKCKISCMEKGEWVEHTGYEVNEDQGAIKGMEQGERYKYLGYLQARDLEHKQAKSTLTDTYLKRLRSILRSKLSGRNISKAINTYATSAISYSFGIIKWTNTELEALNVKTRKEMRKHRCHHPNSAIERLHLPRKLGGRGIPDVKVCNYIQIANLRKYFYKKAETSGIHSSIVQSDRNATPLKLAHRTYEPTNEIQTLGEKQQSWRSKPLHGKYLTRIEQNTVDTAASTAYLRHGNIFPETEGFISAIQDQVIGTRAYKKRILGENIENSKCRLCHSAEETLDHIIAGCTMLAPKAYLDRHNRMGKIVHMKLREQHMAQTIDCPYYEYEPPPVCENDDVRIYWNRKIQTDRPIPNNIPDIILTFKKQNTSYIIDFAVPLGNNIQKTYGEKISKYLPLRDEILQMWNMESVSVVPVVIGAVGEVPKNIKESLVKIGLEHELYIPMQKSVLLDTCGMVRRVIGTE